jgi:predicted DNA-binding transcriptional regulator AlpA
MNKRSDLPSSETREMGPGQLAELVKSVKRLRKENIAETSKPIDYLEFARQVTQEAFVAALLARKGCGKAKVRLSSLNLSVLAQFDSLPDAAYVRLPVVAALHDVGPASIWRWVKSGQICAPKKIGPNTTAWNVGKLRRSMAAAAEEA